MRYRTTCPHCDSVFRLGQDQLDAAQGWAQCGVCGAAFDARASLLMEDGSPLPAAPEPVEPESPKLGGALAAEPETPAEAAAITPPADAPAALPIAEEPPAAESPVGIAQREAPSGLSSIIIIDPDIPVPDDFGPMPAIPPAPAAPAPLMYPPPSSAAPTPPPEAPPDEETEPVFPQPSFAETVDLLDEPLPRPRRSWFWGSAAVLLLMGLLAQSAYFMRDALVSQWPQTRAALEPLCAFAGCTLSLPKNLKMLQIVGSDLATEADGHLRLTLTLGNRSSRAQAWPMLVLTLTDQRNRPLARRSFAPSEYLGDTRRIAAGIPPRSEQALNLPLSVHDVKPMGFDLQLVY